MEPFVSKWTTVKTFTDEDAPGVTVALSKSNHHIPRYSLKVFQKTETALTLPFINLWVDGQRTGGAVPDQTIARLHVMIAKAEEYYLQDAQEEANKHLDWKLANEQKQVNWGKPVARVTGKTEKNRLKKAKTLST